MTKHRGRIRIMRTYLSHSCYNTYTRAAFTALALSFYFFSIGSVCSAQLVNKPGKWIKCLDEKEEWFSGSEAIRIADNLLIYQHYNGGWEKNIDMAQELTETVKKKIILNKSKSGTTIDNNATYTQLRYLAKVYTAAKQERFREAFLKGFDYLLKAQYSNGGWPQFYPLIRGYYTHITFNDNAMIGVMNLFRDVAMKKSDFLFVDETRREKARLANQKGVECILRCQIKVNGRLKAWCAQHDEKTFAPAKARAYELISNSGFESVGIVQFLMNIEEPSAEIINSVQSAISWFNEVKLKGIKIQYVSAPTAVFKYYSSDFDRITVTDSSAPDMWARFYEIQSDRPFFCNRNGIPVYQYSDIERERRTGYNWLGYWPAELLKSEYPKWVRRHNLISVL